MSNVFDAHPWLNSLAGALGYAVVNGIIGKLKKVFTSPGREDFKALEGRLTSQIASLQADMSKGMAGLYTRLDEKTDALNDRIDRILGSGGR